VLRFVSTAVALLCLQCADGVTVTVVAVVFLHAIVSDLDLSFNQLTGTISPQLSTLTRLL
jgi:hypothetical protein